MVLSAYMKLGIEEGKDPFIHRKWSKSTYQNGGNSRNLRVGDEAHGVNG